jgi:hypothetical protein
MRHLPFIDVFVTYIMAAMNRLNVGRAFTEIRP